MELTLSRRIGVPNTLRSESASDISEAIVSMREARRATEATSWGPLQKLCRCDDRGQGVSQLVSCGGRKALNILQDVDDCLSFDTGSPDPITA